ncbi:hypothetical protein [Hyunsoonleella pacifica]|uniref:Uncharacterized protein n=1 Tax=Hyunsoonleella pacifica TaxID=1080224 RepID=A0A4Q9FQ68_9FLAO|nr:hypothetical protein [Hyunsoonleella pacifica]TBN17581.1 hypothetical protein EYD46_04505 [Hyunsoonleella pacifica]GGD10735.1 hypothetical protein GCM10011368_10860 [Hyunsoonleella pacifica]
MVKQITSVLLLSFSMTITVMSQSKIMLHFKGGCHEIKDLQYVLYNLNDYEYSSENIHFYEKQDTIITLKSGLYHIDISILDSKNEELVKSFSIKKEFKENEVYKDTITIPDIIRKMTRVLHYPKDLGFFKCDTICNGEIIEYHKNGNIKSKGIYINGRPSKNIFLFNEEGILTEIKIYDKNGYYKKSKYDNLEKYLVD